MPILNYWNVYEEKSSFIIIENGVWQRRDLWLVMYNCIYLLTCKDYNKQRDQNPKIPSDSYLENCAINTHTKFQQNSDIGKYSSRDLEKPHQVVGPLVQSPRFSFNDQHFSFEMEFEIFFRNFVHPPLYRQKPPLTQSYRYCSLADWIMKLALIFYDIS